MKIFDLNGRVLRENLFSGNSFQLSRQDLQSGFYFLSLIDLDTDKEVRKKIIIN
jgi:hypothetical protein